MRSLQYRRPAARSSIPACAPARRTPIAHAVHGLLLGMALSCAIVPMAAGAAATSDAANAAGVRSYAIGPGPLGHVLAQFAALSGVPLSFDAGLLSQLQSRGLQGSYSVDEGFGRLLSGSGFAAERRADGGYILRKIPAGTTADGTLPQVQVSGKAEAEAASGTVGYVARSAGFATKSSAPLLETPQSVSVITRAEMDSRGVQSVTEALRYVPGVAIETYGPDSKGYDWLMIRGFDGQATSDYRDGLRQATNSYSFFRSEPYGLESIEILRGPSSTLYGQTEAGGMVNRTSKMPVTEPLHEVQAGFGNHNVRQAQFDLGGALDKDGEFSYRLTGLARNGNNVFDDRNERRYVAGGLTWRPSGVTRVTLLADYLSDRVGLANNWSWTYPSPNLRPTHISYSEKEFDKYETEQATFTYLLEHKLSEHWTFNQKARYGKNRLPLFNKTMLNGLQADGVTVNRYAFRRVEDLEQFALDNQLAGDLQLGATRHAVLFGVDANFVNANAMRWIGAEPTLNLSNPVYGQAFTLPSTLQLDTRTSQQQIGLYAQDQMKFAQRWVLTLGGRYDEVRTVTDNHLTRLGRTQNDSAASGRVGLTYLITPELSTYASYSTSFLPQVGVNSSTGNPYDPTRGKQTEVGLKYQPADGGTLYTAAVYNLEKTNVTTTDPATLLTRQVGKVRSRGLELEAKTSLRKGLDLTASYSYTDAKVKQSAVATELGKDVPLVPRHIASAWLDYRLPDGPLAGLGMGAGLRYVGPTYGDSSNLYRVGGRTLADAALYYDYQKWRFAVNANNLFNKQYLSTCSSSACYWGATRSIFTSARYSW
ncbi:TonB-dependent siderophore receptor [Herbaspirillum sp. LeCh32-8]|uniref:TonB-dependent siderophore receptor n=1 Tax=Herbaspirillum sp. LeCh32-8 TaxID=2821356 RepID=UPI001AEAB573|nr:TonB-dependent siderophore receptor [Herbaspirillum sp. LeCh32-8]MBP0599278.1 TonB-dependent siderophore receptor [Herbaspirillum sp. LeCh32-8]